MMSDPSLAVLYGRVSTDKQSTTIQQTGGQAYIAQRGLPLAGEFYDDDVSGSIPIWVRPGGRQLRDRLDQGDIKHLVVAKLDRLGRSAIDLLGTVKLLDALGVALHIVDFGGDSLSSQGPAGRLMFTVLAGMAEFERELIRDRITKHLAGKRDRGELCGTEPYGFNAIPTGELTPKGVAVKRLEDNPEEQQWIRFMVGRREVGVGYHTIAKLLNQLGIRAKHGGQWQSGNVAKVLQNKTVRDWLAQPGHQENQQNAA
jgi:DNA invertase Pin-like site-specific DNA recombinase